MRLLKAMPAIWIVIACLGCKETPEDRARHRAEAAAEYERQGSLVAAADASAKARALRATSNREDLERLEAEHGRKASEEADRQAAQRREAKIQSYREAGAGGRERALIAGEPAGLIAAAAADDKERAHLAKVMDEIDAKAALAASVADVKRRTAFASGYDAALLARHLNPDGVDATGAGKATLSVVGWFCTRQHVHDFAAGSDGAAARAAGFRKIRCTNSIADWWDLEL